VDVCDDDLEPVGVPVNVPVMLSEVVEEGVLLDDGVIVVDAEGKALASMIETRTLTMSAMALWKLKESA